MPLDRPPAADRPPREPPWEVLEQLAANELDPDTAAGWRARIEADPGLSTAYASVVRMQRALDAAPMAPVPAALVRRVREAIASSPGRRLRWPHIAAGWAAAVALCLGGWLAVHGVAALPTGDVWVASLDAPAWLDRPGDAMLDRAHWIQTPSPAQGEAAWPWFAGGTVLLAGGLAFARRQHRQALSRSTS